MYGIFSFFQVGRCMPLDQILTDDEFPQTQRLLDVLKPASLSQIADMKGKNKFSGETWST